MIMQNSQHSQQPEKCLQKGIYDSRSQKVSLDHHPLERTIISTLRQPLTFTSPPSKPLPMPRLHLAIISQSSPSFPACSFLFLPFHLAYNLACNLASISSSHPLYLLSRLSFSSSEASLSNVSGFFLILSRESSLTSHSSSDEFPVLSKCVT